MAKTRNFLKVKYNQAKCYDAGCLFLRIGIGILFIIHGLLIAFGGREEWQRIGSSVTHFGVEPNPILWAYLANLAECAGGFFIAVGFMTRAACIPLIITLIVAAATHVFNNDGWMHLSHAIEALIICIGLLVLGPGKYSADAYLGIETPTVANGKKDIAS